VAIKVLKPERISTDMLKEFAQEVYIMRFVCIIEYNWWSFCSYPTSNASEYFLKISDNVSILHISLVCVLVLFYPS
jgi:hypothetical protein